VSSENKQPIKTLDLPLGGAPAGGRLTIPETSDLIKVALGKVGYRMQFTAPL